MTTLDGFRHQALPYSGDEEYLAGLVPFLEGGMVEGAAMLVVVPPDKIDLLRGQLGVHASSVQFADMTEIGANPARIIPAWQAFLDANRARPMRGIGEPAFPGRDDDELAECRIHEALINPAFSQAAPWWLLCPYDRQALPPTVIHDARGTHPWFGPVSAPQQNPLYSANGHSTFDDPLPSPETKTTDLVFDRHTLRRVRGLVAHMAEEAGLGERRTDLVLAVNEVATNSVRHAGGRGVLRVWRTDRRLVCEIRDQGRISDPLVGRRKPNGHIPGGSGLWMANQLCDLVQIRMLADEVVVRLHASIDS